MALNGALVHLFFEGKCVFSDKLAKFGPFKAPLFSLPQKTLLEGHIFRRAFYTLGKGREMKKTFKCRFPKIPSTPPRAKRAKIFFAYTPRKAE